MSLWSFRQTFVLKCHADAANTYLQRNNLSACWCYSRNDCHFQGYEIQGFSFIIHLSASYPSHLTQSVIWPNGQHYPTASGWPWSQNLLEFLHTTDRFLFYLDPFSLALSFQIACIWFSWCHRHPIISASAKSRTVYPSGTDSSGWSQIKGRKTAVVVSSSSSKRHNNVKES